jgi:hypothetical protein
MQIGKASGLGKGTMPPPKIYIIVQTCRLALAQAAAPGDMARGWLF